MNSIILEYLSKLNTGTYNKNSLYNILKIKGKISFKNFNKLLSLFFEYEEDNDNFYLKNKLELDREFKQITKQDIANNIIIPQDIKNKCGIYFISCVINNITIGYVGITLNFFHRVKWHLKNDKCTWMFNNVDNCTFKCVCCSDSPMTIEELEHTESYLINLLNKKDNFILLNETIKKDIFIDKRLKSVNYNLGDNIDFLKSIKESNHKDFNIDRSFNKNVIASVANSKKYRNQRYIEMYKLLSLRTGMNINKVYTDYKSNSSPKDRKSMFDYICDDLHLEDEMTSICKELWNYEFNIAYTYMSFFV